VKILYICPDLGIPVLRIEAGTASWGAALIYIVVNKVGAFNSRFIGHCYSPASS
jgi:hypothetical protein